MKKKTRYTKDALKHLSDCIQNLKTEEMHTKIYKICEEDSKQNPEICTINAKNAFLNLSAMSDETLDKIQAFLTSIRKDQSRKSPSTPVNNINNNENSDAMDKMLIRAHKLNNFERNILRKRTMENLLKRSNDTDSY